MVFMLMREYPIKPLELVLYNDALTDANMTRLSVIMESKHYIKNDRITGRVTVA